MDEMSSSPMTIGPDGLPRSRRYGDVYFSREGGLAESRAVFLAGCGLPERWAGRRNFTVAELGFGTGLNILALLELWRAQGPPAAHLSIFSVEAEPLSAQDAASALGAWPELAEIANVLLDRWPGRRAGFHRVDLPELRSTLDLAVMEAEPALERWSGRADAWFLDGFSPAVNPGMWTEPLMRLVAARSAPGARIATYTVAGRVRRALAGAGLEVGRRPGFGTKRERLEATAPGQSPAEGPAPRVAIVGAGIAGAALARCFRLLGVEATVLEAAAPGAGASGNPAALVTPRLDAGLGDIAQLHAQAFAYAAGLYGATQDAVVSRGVLQLEASPRDAGRFAKIAASDLFEPGALAVVDTGETTRRLGEDAPAALDLAAALVIEPRVALGAWLGEVTIAAVSQLERADGGWRLIGPRGEVLAEADIVCLASGADLAALWPEAPIQPVRGQLTWTSATTAPLAAASSAYVAPTRGGVMFGATHDRDETDTAPREADDRRNLEALAQRLPKLAESLAGAALEHRASIRATTPDRAPLAGALDGGLYVLGGFGSRGFALAPLLAAHVAALALGAPSPLPAPLARIVDPARFAQRAQRRLGR
jgi:tRNA 5-methylaminomethyl-2-thiouridine biosynthesis bifunctional protein